MKKQRWILPTVLVSLIAVLLVFVVIDGGITGQTVVCDPCDGVGRVISSCDDCDSVRQLTAELALGDATVNEAVCGSCSGVAAITVCEDCEGSGLAAASNYYATWVSLLAPVIAIVLALVTKEVYSSLVIGIAVGGLFVYNFDIVRTVDGVVQQGFLEAVSETAGIFVFLVILGIMVALVNQAGGSAAFGRWAEKNIRSRTGAAMATIVLGVLIFIDDYFNCLTVGGVMRPVTDSHKISRAKLAFLIDATAAPVCMIAPISSWAAAVSGYAAEGEGIKLFVQAIPYNLYSLLMLVFVVAVTVMKLDYGPMKCHELRVLSGERPGTEAQESEKASYNEKGRTLDLILPVIVLVAVCVLALIYVGGFFDSASDNAGDFIGAFGDTDATVGLPIGGFAALIFTIVYLMLRRIVSFKEAMACVPKGFVAMVPAILILTMATGLKNMTGLLGADVYVESLMEGAAAGLSNFLPAIIFLVAVGLSFSTGTSWGTFGILIPIVCSIFPAGSELQIIGISACLAGAVCGDHCSPISDTTIMSSAGVQCDHVDHVSTQLPYATTVAGVSFIGYVLAGLVQNVFAVLGVSMAILFGVLCVLKRRESKKTA